MIDFTTSSTVILLARFIMGISGGAFLIHSPIYISEVAEESIRGALASGKVSSTTSRFAKCLSLLRVKWAIASVLFSGAENDLFLEEIFLQKSKISAIKISLLSKSTTFFINMLFYNFAAPMICYCLGLLESYLFGWVLTYRYIIWANIAFCIIYMGLMMTVKESPVFLMRKKKEEVGYSYTTVHSPLSLNLILQINNYNCKEYSKRCCISYNHHRGVGLLTTYHLIALLQ